MRLGAVAGVPALGDEIAGLHWLSRVYQDSALPKVREQHRGSAGACGDHDVIPGYGRNAPADPFCLPQDVRYERQL